MRDLPSRAGAYSRVSLRASLLAAAVALPAAAAGAEPPWGPYIHDDPPDSSAHLLPERATGCPPFRARSRGVPREEWWELTLSCRHRAIETARAASDPEAEAAALGELGLGYFGDDRTKGNEFTDEAIVIVDRLGHSCWLSALLRLRGSLINRGPRSDDYRLAVEAARQGGCSEQAALSLSYLVSSLPRDHSEASGHLEEALGHARRSGARHTLARILDQLAHHRLHSKDDRALLHFAEIVSLHRAAGDRSREMNALWNFGVAHFALGRPEAGIAYLEQYIELRRAAKLPTAYADENLERLVSRARSN